MMSTEYISLLPSIVVILLAFFWESIKSYYALSKFNYKQTISSLSEFDHYLKDYEELFFNYYKKYPKIKLIGLSGNPVQLGHGKLFDYGSKHYDLVLVIPVYSHVFVEKSGLVTFNTRVLWLEQVTAEYGNVKVVRLEEYLYWQRNEKKPYTSDILKHLFSLNLKSVFTFYLGSDTAVDLFIKNIWGSPEYILKCGVHFLIGDRNIVNDKRFENTRFEIILRKFMKDNTCFDQPDNPVTGVKGKLDLSECFPRISFLKKEVGEFSSTQVRQICSDLRLTRSEALLELSKFVHPEIIEEVYETFRIV